MPSRHLLSTITGVMVLGFSSMASPLAADDAETILNTVCTACHDKSRITQSSGYTKEGWRTLIATMVDLSDDPETLESLTGHLGKSYPPNDRRTPVLVDGPVTLTFREWVTPTLGQRSRDPIEAVDGGIWWAGQWADIVGRIDPVTGTMREIDLPSGAKPHSVTLDADGNVWYTGNKNGTMGRIDPNTGAITEYPMPDPAARDPHTAIFDAKGILWFTLQHSNMIGRLDPATGKTDLVTLPTPGSRPYGIKIDAIGNPWVACNGHNCLVRVDPETMDLHVVDLPHADTTVRRLDIDDDGVIWYVNSRRGRLGRYDPVSGDIKEWPSPSGPKSHPYAIAVLNGAIWYNESGMRPDPLVRFDPETETFQSWPIPSGPVFAGIVRHMRTTRDGGLLIHQSATNRIIKVTID